MPLTALSPQRTHDLHRSYGDTALGKSQGPRLKLTSSGHPRTDASRFGKAVVRQASRLLNAVAPGGLRAAPKFREAVRDCSHSAGDLLAHLSAYGRRDTTNITTLAAAAEKCEARAQVIAACEPGLTASDALGTRFEAHLAQMSLDQLGVLQRGLSNANNCHEMKGKLEVLEKALHGELVQRRDLAAQNLVKELTVPPGEAANVGEIRARARDLAEASQALPDTADAPSVSTVLAQHLADLPLLELISLDRTVDSLRTGPAVEGTLLGSQLQLLQRSMPSVETMFENNLAGRVDDPFEASPAEGVDIAMWKDLPRADYRLLQEDGSSTPLLPDRTHLPATGTPEREDRLKAAADALRGLTANAQQFGTLTKAVNQSLLAGFTAMQLHPHSPTVANGVRGQLVGGADSSTYTLRKAEDGAIIAAIEFKQEGVSQIQDLINGGAVALDPANSRAVSRVELRVGVDGTVSILTSPSIECQLTPAQEVA